MSASNQPRVLLFDIGGVCVKSPFQAILNYELSLGIPPGWVNYSISSTAPNGFWQRVERGEVPLDEAFYRGFNEDLHNPEKWAQFYQREQAKYPTLLPKEVPPLPIMDGQHLFDEMMSSSNFPDPWMFPALQKLKASGEYILVALSNTVIFPPGHRFHREDFFNDPVRKIFDIFISSAHVGIRKPDPKMYTFALQEINKYTEAHNLPPVAPTDIVFLDDIGENLKEGRKQGFRTIKVPLGRAYEAVAELEAVTRLKLEGDHPKIPMGQDSTTSKAKI